MKNVAVQKVKELQPAAKQWVQTLLGRELDEEEEVAVLTFPAHARGPQTIRRAAAARLNQIMDRAAAKAAHIPDEELEALLSEALAEVRPQPS